MVDNPAYTHVNDCRAGSRQYVSSRGTTTMSSSSNASTRHMLAGPNPVHTVMSLGRVTYPFTPPTPETLRYPTVTPPTPELPRHTRNYDSNIDETSQFSTNFNGSRYGTNYTDNSNYRMSFNDGSKYGTNIHSSKYGSNAEISRYDPNFSLSRASPTQTKKAETKRKESRYMVRPVLNPAAKLDPRFFLYPPTPELPRTLVYGSGEKQDGGGGKRGKGGGIYDWHIPRATLWCAHKGCGYDSGPCKHCQLKWDSNGECSGSSREADSASICSSINPPPTFTALDNYRPVRPRPRCSRCSCGIIFAITTLFSLLVLLLIMGFIIYIEMVLKHQTEHVTDRM